MNNSISNRNLNISSDNKDINKNKIENENYFNMLHINFCPNITLKSPTFIISLIIIVVFIIQIFVDGFIYDSDILFTIKTDGIFTKYNILSHENLKKYYLYVLVTNFFFNQDMVKLIINLWLFLFFGSLIEYILNKKYYFYLFFLSQLMGSCFSILFIDNTVKLFGFDCINYGFFGFLLGVLLCNWKQYIYNLPINKIVILILLYSVIYILIFNFKGFKTLEYLGTLLGGVLCGIFMNDKIKKTKFSENITWNSNTKYKFISLIIYIILNGVFLLLFYLIK